jgi:hypothetical protein
MPVTYRFQLARHDTAYWTGVDHQYVWAGTPDASVSEARP